MSVSSLEMERESESANINISLWWDGLWFTSGGGEICATPQGKIDVNERWTAASPLRTSCPQFWGSQVSNNSWV